MRTFLRFGSPMAPISAILVLAGCGGSTITAEEQPAATPTASSAPRADDIVDCRGDALESGVALWPEEAFDKPDTPATPEAALDKVVPALQKEHGTRQTPDAAQFRRHDQGERPGWATFVAYRADGTATARISFMRGGKTNKWLPAGHAICNTDKPTPRPRPFKSAPPDASETDS